MAVASASAVDVQAALSAATDRVLGYEDKLASAATGVLRIAGRSAAKKFGDKAVLTAAAGDGGWEPPHPDELVDVDAIVSALRTKSDPIRRSAIANYGRALSDLHPEANWDVTNPLVGGALSGAAKHVTAIADTTRINLMRIIGASYEEGLSIEDTQKAIREGMDVASQVRGRLIARTELAAVTNGGSLAATQILADATGDTYFKRWMTAPGAHYPRHEDYEELDGQTVALDDHFDVGTASLRFPGDPDGPPEEICNCRCTLAYVSSPDEGEADVGITPFREGVDDPVGFYDSDKFRRFELDAARYADNFGVTIDEKERATGVWEGAEEPSVHFHAHDGDAGVQAFAAALGRAYRQDGVAIFEPGPGSDVIARLHRTRTPIPEAAGNSVKAITRNMGTDELSVNPRDRPDLFKEPTKLKGGGFAQNRNDIPAPRVKTRADKSTYGLPPRLEDTVPGPIGLGDVVVPGSERPPEYLFRAVSEEDYQASLKRGYMRSDQRMNLADEGTVAAFENPSFYLPGKLASDADGVYPGRILRIRYRDEEGWKLDRDGYAKTPEKIPMAQVDLVSPKIETVRGTHARHGGPTFKTRIVATPAVTNEEMFAAMEKEGLPAGRIGDDGNLEIFGSGPEFVAQLERLSGDLGVEYDYYPGKFTLLERDAGDYEKAIGNAQSAEAGQARQAGRGAAELPGHAPLEEGAIGAEAGARPLGDRVLPPGELERPISKPSDFPSPMVGAAPGEDEEALSIVLGGDGTATQAALRTGDVPLWMEKDLATIDNIIARNPVPSETVSIRGVANLADSPFGSAPRIGNERYDPAYGSTSLDPKIATGFAGDGPDSGYITYHLPPGTPALYVPRITNAADEWGQAEKELLIPRGQDLRVIGLGEFRGKPNFHVELVDHPVSTKPPVPVPARATPRLDPIPDVSAPAPPTKWEPPYPPSEAARFGTDRLWGAHSQVGKLENEARRELPGLRDDQLTALLWDKGLGKLPKDTLTFDDLAGDQQVHTFYSDGHNSVQQVADEAMKRGESQIVISDHAHAMTTADIASQHAEIDRLNEKYAGRFKILKGIEANILADGTLDVAPEVLARFDVVNAAIHAHIQGPGGQLALFKEANTARLLRAMDNPELTVLVHPHAVGADWDAVAIKAERKGVALEINGRDMLRNDTQEAAADMIAAAKRHGALLVIGSDAHTAEDLVDLLYAARFAARHGVKVEDMAPLAVRARAAGGSADLSTSIPASLDASSTGADPLLGGMNEVWKLTMDDGRTFVVKPEPGPEVAEMQGFDTAMPLRENIEAGADLERERATYVFSRLFNEAGGEDFQVYTPPYRLGEFTREPFIPIQFEDDVDWLGHETTSKAGVMDFIKGTEARKWGGDYNNWGDWFADDVPTVNAARRRELKSAALFDEAIGNTDRHAGNFMFGDDGHLWLIDHGLTFPSRPAPDQFQNKLLVNAALGEFRKKLAPAEVAFLERLRDLLPNSNPLGPDPAISTELRKLLSPEEIDQIRARIDHMIQFGWRSTDLMGTEFDRLDG